MGALNKYAGFFVCVVFLAQIPSTYSQETCEAYPGINVCEAPYVPYADAINLVESREMDPDINSPPEDETGPGGIPTPPTMEASGAPSSIDELARALKYDVDLIYQFVYDNIEYYPIYGVQKGALGALIDGYGTDFDQAMLMVELLRASGYTANYVKAKMDLTAGSFASFYGLDAARLEVSARSATNLLADGGFPYTGSTDGGTWDDPLLSVEVEHVLVKVVINSTAYYFDPSYKEHTEISGIDLAAVMGYSQTSYLGSGTGGATNGSTVTANYIQNVNRNNIRAKLGSYANALTNHIKNNAQSTTLDGLIGGRAIIPVNITSPLRRPTVNYIKIGDVPVEYADLPSNFKPTLQIQYLGINKTYTSDYLYGKRVFVKFNASNKPELYIDGVKQATGTTAATSGSSTTISLSVKHKAYPSSFADATTTQTIKAGGSFVISNGWGRVTREMVNFHQQKLTEYKAAGNADNSEPMLGTSLAILSNTWMAQRSQLTALMDILANTVTVSHHLVGIAGQDPAPKNAPYVDMPGNSSNIVSRVDDVEMKKTALYVFATHASAFESLAVQHVTSASAVSTVKLFDIAAQTSGNKFFDAKSTNYTSSVKPSLTSYTTAQLNGFQTDVNAGKRLILPDKGNLTENTWSGASWLALTNSHVGSVIGGGLLGGNATQPVSEAELNAQSVKDSLASLSAEAQKLISDPVDHFRGNYIYSHDDIVLGSGEPFPYTLSFQRTYNSGERYKLGSLGNGGSHNFDITAEVGSDAFQIMGEDSALDSVATIAELFVTIDVLRARDVNNAIPLTNIVVSALAERWFTDQALFNTVSIKKGSSSELFIKLPDGTYNPPSGSNVQLSLVSGKYKYETPDKTTLDFNDKNAIYTWKNAAGVTVTFAYTGTPAKLSTIGNGMGRTLTLSYSGALVSGVSDGNGRSISYIYDTTLTANKNNLLTYKDPLNKSTTMTYSGQGQLFKMFYPANPTNPLVTNTYDSLGRVMEQADPNGKITKFYFAGTRTEMINPLLGAKIFYNTRSGSIKSEKDERGKTTSYLYDGLNRVTSKTLPEGNKFTYSYDAYGNVLTETRVPKAGQGMSNTVTTYTYDPVWHKVETVTDARNNITTYTYDATKGTLSSITKPDPDGAGPFSAPVISYTYNARGQVLTKTDAVGETKYVYHATNETLTSVTEDFGGLGLTTQYGYNGYGDVTSVTDPEGNVASHVFNAVRRKTQTTLPDPDGAGSKSSPVTKFTYDDNGNLTKVENKLDALWQTTNMTYNYSDKLATKLDPLSHLTTYAYDDLDRLSTVTDAESRITNTTYDAVGNILTITKAFGTPDARAETRAYSNNGMMTNRTDSRGKVTTYAYDSFDRLKQVNYPTRLETMTYDAVDNMLTFRTKASQTITYTYDNLNRRVTKSVPGQALTTFGYDERDRLVSAAYSGTLGAGDAMLGSWTRSYDDANRMLNETRPDGKSVSNLYDNNGNKTQVTYPDNWYAQYAVDNLNHLITVKENDADTLVSYGYDQLGRKTDTTFGNGAAQTRVFDIAGRLESQQDNLTTSNTVSFGYGYNNVNQKTSAQVSDITFLWTPALTSNLGYGAANTINQYPSVGGITYSYDNGGNLTSDGVFTYVYDYENRLTSATSSTTSVTFKYDPLGRRFSKTSAGVTTEFVHDGSREIAEYVGGALSARHVFSGADQAFVTYRGADKVFAHTDLQRSVIAMTDSARNLRGQATYSPWGESGNISRNTSFGYTGQRYDSETGLYYYKARYYNPVLGRFLSQDPLGYADNVNLYAYVANDPLNYYDPSGLAMDAANGMAAEQWGLLYGSNFAVGAEAYMVLGGGLNAAWKNGTLELTGKVGVGYGGGLSFDPNGVPSPHAQSSGSGVIARTVYDGSAQVGYGAGSVGLTGRASTGNAVTTKVGGDYTEYSRSGMSVDTGSRPGAGVRFGASVSVEAGSYTNW